MVLFGNLSGNSMNFPKTGRLVWVDLFKGFAVLVMIQGHVSTMLLPAIRHSSAYAVLDFINGIVAPSFLFTAGALFLIVMKRKLTDLLSFGPLFWRQLRRVGGIILLGYLLHLPFYSLVKTVTHSTPVDLKNFLQVDVLQCIGVSILLLLLLTLIFRKRERVVWAAAVLAGILFFGAPFTWNYLPRLPFWLVGYFNGSAGSRFPLFPFGGFLLAGAVIGYLYDQVKEKGREARFVGWFVIIGVVLIVIDFILHFQLRTVYARWHWNYYYWSAPTWFFIKFGIVFILVGGFWYWERVLAPKSGAKIPTMIFAVVGAESLLAYAGHIPIVFGSVLGHGIKGLVDSSLGWGGYALISVGVMVLTIGVCWVWHEVKKFSPRLAFWFLALFWAHLVARFLLRPY
jgi:uncharacterized membrane protein